GSFTMIITILHAKLITLKGANFSLKIRVPNPIQSQTSPNISGQNLLISIRTIKYYNAAASKNYFFTTLLQRINYKNEKLQNSPHKNNLHISAYHYHLPVYKSRSGFIFEYGFSRAAESISKNGSGIFRPVRPPDRAAGKPKKGRPENS
ncbi:MAG: hypothetical protein JW837_09245, partial [Sedimentisphaerales bacterium]|nr:hypothetical protein [Sedimentisphaerales bacterium]